MWAFFLATEMISISLYLFINEIITTLTTVPFLDLKKGGTR